MILELVRLDIFKICGVIIESKLANFPVFSFHTKFQIFYLPNVYNLIHGIYCENFIFILVFCITIKKMYLYNNSFVLIAGRFCDSGNYVIKIYIFSENM